MSNDYSFCQESSYLRTSVIRASVFQLEEDNLTALEECVGHPIQNRTLRAFKRAQVGRTQLTSRHYKKHKKRNNFTVVYCNGTQIKYAQVEFFFTHEESGNSSMLALICEFKSADICLLQDYATSGTCFHIVPLLETPVRMVVVTAAGSGQSCLYGSILNAWPCFCGAFPQYSGEILAQATLRAQKR